MTDTVKREDVTKYVETSNNKNMTIKALDTELRVIENHKTYYFVNMSILPLEPGHCRPTEVMALVKILHSYDHHYPLKNRVLSHCWAVRVDTEGYWRLELALFLKSSRDHTKDLIKIKEYFIELLDGYFSYHIHHQDETPVAEFDSPERKTVWQHLCHITQTDTQTEFAKKLINMSEESFIDTKPF